MPNLIKKFQNTCFQHSLLKKGDKIVVAVSGGSDSVCMLDIFSELKKKYSLELIIVHVNYGLRGVDSQKDEKLVRKLAKDYGLEIEVLSLSFPREKEKLKISENHLRNIRYDFFEKIRRENSFGKIVLAHNLDDQVETFLMRLIRGAGLLGLSSMQFKNKNLIRPLINVSREEILKYLKEKKLKYRIDKTNLENDFLRNKIRNKLIPFLRKNFNPKISETIFNSSISIAEDYALISELIGKKMKIKKNFNVSDFEKMLPSIRKGIIRKIIENTKGDLKNIEASHIEEIIKIIKSKKNKTHFFVFQNLRIIRKGDKLSIEKK